MSSILLFSQYKSDISLPLAWYDPEWLEYIIFSNELVSSKDITERHMLHMRNIGGYNVQKKIDMYKLSSILVAIVIKDHRSAASSS